MSVLFSDTSTEAEEALICLLRKAPPWRKLEMVGQLNATVRTLALCGLRKQYPRATSEELRRHLAALLLGEELAADLCIDKGEILLTEPISVTLLVTEVLDKLKIPYFIGGSLASAVYGLTRTTIDADIIADIKPEKIIPLEQMLRDDFYVSIKAIQDAVIRQSSFNIIHLKTMFKVDIFVMKSRPFDKMQFQRRVREIITTNPAHAIYIASGEDTVLAKLEWFRQGGEISEKQWKDILGILKVQWERLDMSYLQYWAEELKVSDLLEKALWEVINK